MLIWWRIDSARLGRDARRAIEDETATVFVSAASIWELSIKRALARYRDDELLAIDLAPIGFAALPIGFDHAALAGTLPAHHADPFDRMLVAQASIERLTLISHDRRFAAYDVSVIWT